AWPAVKDGGGPGRLALLRRRVRPGLRPPKGRTRGRRGRTPVVTVTGGASKRVSLAALIAVRPGRRPRLVYRTRARRPGSKRKGFTETDYARFPAPRASSSAGRSWSCGTT